MQTGAAQGVESNLKIHPLSTATNLSLTLLVENANLQK